MKTYLVPCECSASIPVTAGQAGGPVRCPACGVERAIPRLGSLAPYEVQPTVAAATRRPWSAGHACGLAGLALALATGTGALAIDLSLRRAAAAEHAQIRSAVSAAPADEIVATWWMIAARGLSPMPDPATAAAMRRARALSMASRLLWVGAGAGIVLALGGAVALVTSRAQLPKP
jgi:hypothetical protein